MKSHLILAMGVALLLFGADAAAQKVAKDAELFAKVLRTDKDPERRLQATRELAGIARLKVSYVQPHTGLLLDTLRQDSDTAVRVGAGNVLLAFEADAQAVVPTVLALLKNNKEPGAVLAVCARLAGAYQARDAIATLQALRDREAAKDDPKLRDQRLLQAVNQALQALMK